MSASLWLRADALLAVLDGMRDKLPWATPELLTKRVEGLREVLKHTRDDTGIVTAEAWPALPCCGADPAHGHRIDCLERPRHRGDSW